MGNGFLVEVDLLVLYLHLLATSVVLNTFTGLQKYLYAGPIPAQKYVVYQVLGDYRP